MGRHLAAAVVAMMAVAGIGDARAQDYPTRTATVIVPFAAGGPADITGRIVADIFRRYLGQKFVVENVVGAGGTTGTLRAAPCAADGYTLLSGHLGTNALAPAFYPNLAYDPQKDFAADWADRRISRNCWSSERIFRPTTSGNSSPMQKPTRKSSMSDTPGLARCPISAVCCCIRRSASSQR